MRRAIWIWPGLIFGALILAALLSYCEPEVRTVNDELVPTSTIVVRVLPTDMLIVTVPPRVTSTAASPETLRTALPTLVPLTPTLRPVPPPTLEPPATPVRTPVQKG